MKPFLKRFDALRESREYVFDYDDLERIGLRVEETDQGFFRVSVDFKCGPFQWKRLPGAYERRPTLRKLAKIAAEQIEIREVEAATSKGISR